MKVSKSIKARCFSVLTFFNSLFEKSPLPIWLSWGITLACSGYVCCVFILTISPVRPPILTFPIWLLTFFIGLACFWGKGLTLKLTAQAAYTLKAWKITLWVLILYWLVILFCGMFSTPDTDNQWQQVLSSRFDDWHPVLHTLSIWIFAQIIESQLFVGLVQCGIFACLCGWLCRTLQCYNYKQWVIITVLAFTALSPASLCLMRVLWKDCAFALAAMALSIMLIHLWHTHGEWLLKPRRVALFCSVVVLASYYRHNGIFLTIPLCLLLPFLFNGFRQKSIAIGISTCALLCIIGYSLVRHSLIMQGDFLTDKHPHRHFSEAVGLPMSMMGEAFVTHPERIPEDVKTFLLTMGSEKEWKENWRGDFNNVKFTFAGYAKEDGRPFSGAIISSVPSMTFFDMFMRTCIAAPQSTLKALLHVTSLAWSPLPKGWFDVPATGRFFNNELNFILRCCIKSPLACFFIAPGMYVLLWVLFGCLATIRFGWKSTLLFLPFVAYAFGTAFLLTGWDYRFFFALTLCIAPTLCLCVTPPSREK